MNGRPAGESSEDEKLQAECLRYFQERPVFGKLLCGFREKYLSYGRFVGTVTLKNLKESEREDLEGFLLRNYHGKKSASVSAERFEKALSGSRFAGISGKDVLELYFREPVEGRKEQRQREDRRWTAILDGAKKEAGALSARWIDEISEMQSSGFMPYLKRRDREAGVNLDEAERLLMLGVQILDALPVRKVSETIDDCAAGDRAGGIEERGKKAPDLSGMPARYLAVFAAEITGNPHAFDAGTKDGKYLEMLVEWYVRRTEAEAGANGEHGGKNSLDRAFPAFRKQKLFLKAGRKRRTRPECLPGIWRCSRQRSRGIPTPSTRAQRTGNIWKCWWNGMCKGQGRKTARTKRAAEKTAWTELSLRSGNKDCF